MTYKYHTGEDLTVGIMAAILSKSGLLRAHLDVGMSKAQWYKVHGTNQMI